MSKVPKESSNEDKERQNDLAARGERSAMRSGRAVFVDPIDRPSTSRDRPRSPTDEIFENINRQAALIYLTEKEMKEMLPDDIDLATFDDILFDLDIRLLVDYTVADLYAYAAELEEMYNSSMKFFKSGRRCNRTKEPENNNYDFEDDDPNQCNVI